MNAQHLERKLQAARERIGRLRDAIETHLASGILAGAAELEQDLKEAEIGAGYIVQDMAAK
jgi:hypothetical protein